MAKSKAMMPGASWDALARLTVLAVACGAVACGAAQRPPPAEQSAAAEEAAADDAIGAAPECVDEKDQPVSCLSDADCCAGFVCGKDPELSHRLSYCIYGG